MKKIINQFLILKFFIIIFLSVPYTLQAQIAINKYYLIMEDGKRNENITVYNRGIAERTYKIELVNYKQKEDGGYERIMKENKEVKFANPYLIFTPKSFTLPSGGSQVIRLQKRNMVKAPDGEYTSHLLITEQDDGKDEVMDNPVVQSSAKDKTKLSFDIKPLFALSVPVVVRKGSLTSNVSLGQSVIKGDSLETILIREGTASSRGDILLKQGNTVIAESKNINIFEGNHKRKITVAIDPKKLKGLKGKDLTLQYISYPDNKVVASKNIKF